MEFILLVDGRTLGLVLAHGPDVAGQVRSESAMLELEACPKRPRGEILVLELLLRLACRSHHCYACLVLRMEVTQNDSARKAGFPAARMMDDTTEGLLNL